MCSKLKCLNGLFIILVTLILVGCSNNTRPTNIPDDNEDPIIKDDNNNGQKENEKKDPPIILDVFKTSSNGRIVTTNIDLFKEIMASGKGAVIYVGSEYCPACVRFYPTIESLARQLNVDFFYTDLSKWSHSDKTVLYDALTGVRSTPTLVIVNDGELVEILVGVRQNSEVIDFLRRNGIIK